MFTKQVRKAFMISLLFFIFFIPAAQAQLSFNKELSCTHIYQVKKRYLDKHIIYTKLNKTLERRTVEQFIKRLDGSKIYLLEKDVAKIKGMLSGIFRKTQSYDCAPIFKAYDYYAKKVDERISFIKTLLSNKKFKFNPKVSFQIDPDRRTRPTTRKSAEAYHKKYIQYQISNYLQTDMSLKESRERVIRNYERVGKKIEQVKIARKREILDDYVDSFARALDPHSSYLSKDQLEDFEIQMRLSLEGIGATLSNQDGFTVIEQLIPGGAAFGSGKLKSKDKIIEVAQGEKGNPKNVIEMELRDVVRLIRGKKGTKVTLTILRKNKKTNKRFKVTLVRDKIKLEDEAASLDVIEKKFNDTKKKIGLVNLPSFYADNRKRGRSSARDMKKLLRKARKEKVDAIVLDLSNNGGGSLDDAVKIAGLFFKKGNVVKQSTKDVEGGEIILADRDALVDWPGPLVVLISRISASASEIVSGTLQDYNRAVVVGGDHTFGKGSVQSVEYLPPGLGALKTTVGKFFTAGGASTQHQGVDSHIVFPSAFSTAELGEKTLDYSLPPKKIKSFLSSEAYVNSGDGAWKVVSDRTIKKLKKNSKKRIKSSEKFSKIKKDVKKSEARKGVINVAELMKEKEDEKKENGEDKKEEEDRILSKEERKKKYLERADIQEAINIAVDLIAEQGGVEIHQAKAPPKKKKEKKEN